MSATTTDIIGDAVYQNKALSREGGLERLFAMLFRGLVYPQIWEDPVCDMPVSYTHLTLPTTSRV